MTVVPGRWLDQVESLARDVLPGPVFRYIAEGARDEITVGEAVTAWQSLRLAPHVLRDVRDVDTSTRLVGRDFRLPLGIAPMTLQRAADPDGEVAMARGAEVAGVPFVVSSNAGSTFADIEATGVTWWLQVYLAAERSDSGPLLASAVAHGAAAIVLTADTPVVGTRYPDRVEQRVWEVADPSWLGANTGATAADRSAPDLLAPQPLAPESRSRAMDLGPGDIAWLAEGTGLPVVVKGVLRADDARECAAAGASAVWVSNHGGRQLDQVAATATSVAAVRAAVGERTQVYVDGGVRSGLHVLLGLSQGADAVFVGRPMFHALAAGGQDGVVRALAEYGVELVESMRLAGCRSVEHTGSIAYPDRANGV